MPDLRWITEINFFIFKKYRNQICRVKFDLRKISAFDEGDFSPAKTAAFELRFGAAVFIFVKGIPGSSFHDKPKEPARRNKRGRGRTVTCSEGHRERAVCRIKTPSFGPPLMKKAAFASLSRTLEIEERP